MRKCSNCGFDNDDSSKFCVGCGAVLPEAVAPVATPVAPAPQVKVEAAPSQQVAPRAAAPSKTSGLCIAGFVVSLISIPLIGIPAIIGLILSICGLGAANKKNLKGKGFAIAGIVISILAGLFFLLVVGLALMDMDDYFDDFGGDLAKEIETRTEYEDLNIERIIKNENWVLEREGSYLVFESGNRFRYYETYGDDDSSYYEGTYEIYVGRDAIEYVSEDLEEYGVTEEEIEELLAADSDYCEENFVCIVLNNESCMVDGVNTLDEEVMTPYIGNYLVDDDESGLDLTNMNQATHVYFVPEDQYDD
ncbi:MAG: zinc-ribbon domain-containing protein [Saccharofermentans sp.]|nr:zinc-ribbon domain-containing protein [Saccharofermentans sp.]